MNFRDLEGQVLAFAEACYDQNSVHELQEIFNTVSKADPTDLKTWDITAEEWHQAIRVALDARRSD